MIWAIKDAVLNRSMFNIIDHASGFKADFLVLKDDPFRQKEFTRRLAMEFSHIKPFYVVSLEEPYNFQTNMDTGSSIFCANGRH